MRIRFLLKKKTMNKQKQQLSLSYYKMLPKRIKINNNILAFSDGFDN